MAQDKKIVGVFETEQGAYNAIEGLKREGYSADEISVVGRNRDDVRNLTDSTDTKMPEGAAIGASTGGILGGAAGLLAGLGLLAIPGIGPILAAGPIAATLAGAAAGAGAGGILGGLIGLGIPEEDAERYEAYFNEGRILVMVDVDADRHERVYDTFRTNDSLNADMYGDAPFYGAGMYDTDVRDRRDPIDRY